jgi:hypothetical protein
MARPTKRRVPGSGGGRTTPKGGGSSRSERSSSGGESSGRYTPPTPQYVKSSPIIVPIIMFTLLGLGLVVILANYLGLMPGDTSNWYLLLGLGLILGGILTATQYH